MVDKQIEILRHIIEFCTKSAILMDEELEKSTNSSKKMWAKGAHQALISVQLYSSDVIEELRKYPGTAKKVKNKKSTSILDDIDAILNTLKKDK